MVAAYDHIAEVTYLTLEKEGAKMTPEVERKVLETFAEIARGGKLGTFAPDSIEYQVIASEYEATLVKVIWPPDSDLARMWPPLYMPVPLDAKGQFKAEFRLAIEDALTGLGENLDAEAAEGEDVDAGGSVESAEEES